METKKYRIGDLKESIRKESEKLESVSKKSVLEANETKNEFEPVFGKHVPQDNKKINTQQYDLFLGYWLYQEQ